ncbi:glycerol-3-phosphate acyltransferase 3 isoform X1 [Ursus arctos]|uniref:glycerol-3-phosphate acyltransferase 3 isoform X1 n=2 Tax=Ursus arctos TaxID=9644 RepID=UPI0025475105|nr:glycerol-3-phosphate acyltransferase 3 isoform X1 [Ursus arctos]XP_057165621.1 glycerol-3-phosphate acyltransferase 3 isoform X1 [Ursus arctos]XP_057165622.1 glycerol-3-phosphate acyltransferase 3 isoform X1 [Ursus arctos]
MEGAELAGKILSTWLTLVLCLILLPSVFGVSLGISEVYMKILVKTLEWATIRIEKGVPKESGLKNSASVDAVCEHCRKLETTDKRSETPYSHLNVKDIGAWLGLNVGRAFLPRTRPPQRSSSHQEKPSLPVVGAPTGIIQRDESPMEKGLSGLRGRDFELSDVFYFSKKGLEAIVEDEVTQRFSSEELVSWNLLTRTNINFQYISLRLTTVWVLGVIVRYCVLLPLRVTLAFIGISLLVIGTTLVGQLPDSSLKNWLSELVHLTCCRICVRALSGTIHYHNKQYRPQKGGICVANHTSPIDVLILTTDGCYAMVGQVHGGLMGIIQRAMVKACPHVWFERSEMKDRHLVTKRLKEHIADKKKLPILIFPEGTCINNTSVMMFKKGSFEIGGTIHPVAIKYNPQFGDAFWNSSKYNMVSYLLRMMTSWAIVCDVWYMPPMTREEGEDAVQFANRVKSAIAVQGGLTELPWDGGLKRAKVKDTFKEEQQKNYSKMIVGNGSL